MQPLPAPHLPLWLHLHPLCALRLQHSLPTLLPTHLCEVRLLCDLRLRPAHRLPLFLREPTRLSRLLLRHRGNLHDS